MAARGSTIGLQKSLLSNYRRNIAKRKNPLPFDLTFEEFSELIHQNCYICGSAPSNKLKYKNRTAILYYNGIDRVDNSLGYVMGNVMPCCSKCNSVKSDWSLEEVKNHLVLMLRGLEAL